MILKSIRYRGAIFSFMAAMLVFMGLFDILMFRELERIVLQNSQQQTRRELALMGNFTREAMLRHDFVTVQQFLNSWAEEHEDILELRATSPADFLLVDFARPLQEKHFYQFRYQVEFAERPLLTLELTRDFQPVMDTLGALRLQMATRSALLTVLLGIALWYILRQLAIAPLEREVSRRREAEKRFRDLLEGAPDGMALVDQDGIIVLTNVQMERMFGFSREELVGRKVETLIPERRQKENRQYLKSFFRKTSELPKESTSLELSASGKAGREFPAEISLNPLETGGELYLLIAVRDISARKQMERALQESEQRYREFVEGTDNLITQVNEQGEFTFVNHQANKIFGVPPEECRGVSLFDFIHPDDRERTREALREWTEKKYPSATIEIRQVSKTGEARDLLWTVNLHFSQQGDILAINSIGRDITQRKKAEEKIKRGFQLQSTINEILKVSLEPLPLDQQLERVLDLILAVPSLTLEGSGCIYLVEEDPQTLIMKAQRGFSEESMRNCSKLPFGKCLCGKAASRSEVVFAGCLTELHEIERLDIGHHGHYCVPITSGERIYGVLNILLREHHIRDKEEEQFLSSVANTIAGMVERHRTEKEKAQLQDQLLESEKLSALGRMTANIAHEVRNPLTVVGGLAKRLDQCLPDAADEKKYTRTIMAQSLRLERILQRVDSFILDLPLEKHKLNFNRMIEENLAKFRDIFKGQSIEISTNFSELPNMEVDRRKTQEVMENLIDNALDAMPEGGRLAVQTRREELQGRDYAVVEVSDTGKGIPAEEQLLIFEPFFTTKAVGMRHAVGLGLPISKKIMTLHGGMITVESKPGEGSTFRLFFPI